MGAGELARARARAVVPRRRSPRDAQRVAADRRRSAARGHALAERAQRLGLGPLTRKPPGALAEQRGARGQPGDAARRAPPARRGRPARQHSASATARPPSAMSWALESAPARTASRTARCAARDAPSMSISGSAVGERLAAQLGELARRRATARTARRARSRRRRARSRARPARRASGRRPTMPITGVG